MTFEEMFLETRGRPIQYRGSVLHLAHSIDVTPPQAFRLTFISASGRWKQGAAIEADAIRLSDGRLYKNNYLRFWYDDGPRVIDFTVLAGEQLMVWNVWEIDGNVESGHNGAAMRVTDNGTTTRYECNDGYPDEDLDDVVFEIARLP